MAKGANQKVVILGFGHLMEYLRPCYLGFLGENASDNLVATTVDTVHYEEKKRENGFPILLGDNECALATRPNIILFAPPPAAAKDLAEKTLLPFYKMQRAARSTLPDLYVFPPSPGIDYYKKTLGEDVNAVAILPNMTNRIAGRDVAAEGFTLLTFPTIGSPWPKERLTHLKELFRPLGNTLELTPAQTVPVLASSVACNVFCDVIHMMEDKCRGVGWSMSELCAAMRRDLYALHPPLVAPAISCGEETELRAHRDAVKQILTAWLLALETYLSTCGLEEKKRNAFLAQRLDSFLQIGQAMQWEEIVAMREKRATPGGSLDCGLRQYRDHVKEISVALDQILFGREGGEKALSEIATAISKAVCAHSLEMGR